MILTDIIKKNLNYIIVKIIIVKIIIKKNSNYIITKNLKKFNFIKILNYVKKVYI